MPQIKGSEELIIEAKSFFNTYKKEIGESIRKGKKVVFIKFDDMASHSPTLSEALISRTSISSSFAIELMQHNYWGIYWR